MDPVQKLWHYENWLADRNDQAELAKSHAYLVGSFWNPEAVKQLVKGNDHESTDEEYEESINIVKRSNAVLEKTKESVKKRKKRRIKN